MVVLLLDKPESKIVIYIWLESQFSVNSRKFNAGLLNYFSITNVAEEIRETLSNIIKLT